jgi:serine palmitoyltransferase
MKIPYYVILPSYFAYALGFIFGHLRDFVSFFRNHVDKPPKGYAPLCRDFEDFYTRRMYRRIQDCFNRPIASAPNTWIDVIERVSHDNVTLVRTKNTRRCINLGSYNYLGFAAQDEYCTPRVIECLEKFGASACASRVECGKLSFLPPPPLNFTLNLFHKFSYISSQNNGLVSNFPQPPGFLFFIL